MGTARTIILTNIITGVTILIGFGNNVVIATYFGLNDKIDAYFAAAVIPTFISGLLVTYIGKTFLPIFSKLREKSIDDASRFVSTIVTTVFLLTTAVVALVDLFAEPLLSIILPGLEAENISIATNMLWILSPSIVFMSITVFNSYVWQYEGKYIRVVAANLFLPVSVLLAIFFGREVIGEYSLAIGYVLGKACVLVVLAIGVSYHFRPSLRIGDENVRKVFSSSALLLATGVIGKSRNILEKTFASMLGEGAISALAFSNKVCQPLQQSSTIGVRMIAFSKSSKLMAAGQQKEVGRLTSMAVVVVMGVLVPMVVWLGINSYEIIDALFKRGKFTDDMHGLVVLALIGLVPMVVFNSVNPILSNALFVIDKVRVQAWLGPIGTVTYIILAFILMHIYGITGLALSMSITAFGAFCILSIALGRQLAGFSTRRIVWRFLIYCIISVPSYLIAYWIAMHLEFSMIFQLIVSMGIGSLLYLLFLIALRDDGYIYIRNKFFTS